MNGLKTGVHHKISSRSWGPFTVLFMTTKMDNRRIKSASKWFLLRLKRRKPVAISYHQVRTVKRKLPREDLVKQWLQHDE